MNYNKRSERIKKCLLDIERKNLKMMNELRKMQKPNKSRSEIRAEMLEEFRDWNAWMQKNVCIICQEEFSQYKRKCIDHCHETGKFRGILCNNYNSGLGMFSDNVDYLENAIKYLKRYK